MCDIDNELILFINENPTVFKENVFESFNSDRKWQGKSLINYEEFHRSIDGLVVSNRIEVVSSGFDNEFVFYKSNSNTNSLKDIVKINRNVINLNRIFNYLILKNGASADELTEKFFYKPGHSDFDLSEDELWHYISYLKINNCIKEERIDNYNFMYTPLEISLDIFSRIEDITEVKKREIEIEKENTKNIPWYKTLGSIFLFFVSIFIAFYIYAYVDTYVPFLIPLIVLIGVLFKKRRRIGYR